MASQANSLHDPEEKRLVFIDALRVAAIVFVIIHHAAQTFGPTGGFGPCMIARKATGSLRSIPQMPPLAWD